MSSRWGPSKEQQQQALVKEEDEQRESIMEENGDSTTGNGTMVTGIAMAQHHSDEAASNDFELIDEVEWGPRRDEDGYDTDQELAPKPRRKPAGEDLCGCFPPVTGFACIDESCVLYACREECRSNCLAASLCGNKRIQRKEFSDVEVFDAGIKGKGLRLSKNTKPAVKGDIMCEYLGRAIREKALSRLFRRYQFDRRLYIMSLGDGIYLDARQKGGIARYINHSCRPNCKVELWTVRGVVRAAVVALCPIEPGGELTFDYQWERRRGRAPTVCHCGTPECRGTLEVPKSMEEQDLQREFQGHWEQIPAGHRADQTYVNRTVQIYSKEHKEYFLGEVTGYDSDKGLHCILYRQGMNEVWEDLSKEDWMILNEKIDKENFIIAKKVSTRRSATEATPITPLLVASTSQSDMFGGVKLAQISKNYLYVQTPVKEMLWSMHFIERCERNFTVQITAEQMSRPPIPAETEEDVEKYSMLDLSRDSTVWKLTVTGSDIPKACGILRKNVNFIEKKLTFDEANRSARSTPTNTLKQAPASLNVADIHEVAFPRIIEDVVKRRLQTVRDKSRNVTFTYVASDVKNTQVIRLSLGGSIVSDIDAAKGSLWQMLLEACAECNAPMKTNNMYRHVGFLGGTLSKEEHRLLMSERELMADINAMNTRERLDDTEEFNSLHFIKSFENTYECGVWIYAHDDQYIREGHSIVEIDTFKVYFGCDPPEVSRIFAALKSHVDDLRKGVKFIHLGDDRMFMKLLKMNGAKLFELVKQVTGITVSVDPMIADQLRAERTTEALERLSASDQFALASEIIRIQIDCYRDECIRQQPCFFGRDWTVHNASFEDVSGSSTKPAATLKLDRRSASQYGMDIADIISKLELDISVAGHAATILYRFIYSEPEFSTQLKIREALLACIFLANKAQKMKKWKRLDTVVEIGYETLHRGSNFDKTNEEAMLLEERVVAAEQEILQKLDYDIFWCDVEHIRIAATGSGKMKKEFVQTVFEFTFSGPVLGAGAELWIKYGIEYIFAASASLLKANIDHLVNALTLVPSKISSAARLLVELAKYGRPTSDTSPSNPLLESLSGKKKLLEYCLSIERKCSQIKSSRNAKEISSDATPTENRFKIIGNESRRCYLIQGIAKHIAMTSILPNIEMLEAESDCRMYFCSEAASNTEDLILFGCWRSIFVADNLLRSKLKNFHLPPAVDISNKVFEHPCEPAKLKAGILQLDDVCTEKGWHGTVLLESTRSDTPYLRIGGKYCIPSKISKSALRKSGLNWWNTCDSGLATTGSIFDILSIRAGTESMKEKLSEVAGKMYVDSNLFPILTDSTKSGASNLSFKPVSYQKWPPEKIEKKERKMAETKQTSSLMGFSPAALQEMQVLKQVHCVIPSTTGHSNFVVPIGVALDRGESLILNGSPSKSMDVINSKMSLADPILSLFHSNDAAITETQHEANDGGAYIVFSPVPFVLQRFISRKMRSSDDGLMITDTVLSSWFHDLLSALVHCHENHILLRTIMSDQIFINHAGVAMIGSMYRCTRIPINERATTDPVKVAKSARKRNKKDADNEVTDDPFIAPEILLGSPDYSKASDVWVVGSLLASVMLNKPIFTGKDRESLLLAQYKIVGAPSGDNYEDGLHLPYYTKPVKKYRRGVEKALEHILKETSPQQQKAIDLISRMLHLDPKKRCTAIEALGHEYMSDFIDNCQSYAFRMQYASDWIRLKSQMLQSYNDDPDEQSRKRNAMIRSVSRRSTGDEEEDDLYNMDEFLDHSSSPKKPRFE